MTEFEPFAATPQETVLASYPDGGDKLTIASDRDGVSIYGNLDLVRDPQSLEAARALLRILETTIAALEGGPLDPTAGKVDPDAIETKDNPFG